MTYPVQTVTGEQVMIVEKLITEADAIHDSTILVADDGRKFRPTRNGLKVVEVSDAEAAAEASSDNAGEAAGDQTGSSEESGSEGDGSDEGEGEGAGAAE